jgi:hypothetical protein
MNNYQEGHCHYFAAKLYSILQDNDVKCKYCVVYGHHVNNDDEHFAETLNHCYVKVGKYYYDSRGKNNITDIKEREQQMMESLSNEESYYYTDRKLTNKINEAYFTEEPLLPLDYNELEKDVKDYLHKFRLIPE